MSTVIQIPVPPSEDSLSLVRFAQESVAQLLPAMDLEVTEFDSKAQVDQIEILSVDAKAESILITFHLKFSASYTCSGIDYAGTHIRTLRGSREDNLWIFPAHQPTPSRSTVDEF